MIPAGSTVQIDTRKYEISPKQDWAYSLRRPIYFLKTRDGYFCGWCELDEGLQMADPDPPPAIVCSRPEMEVWARSRKPGAGCRSSRPVRRMFLFCEFEGTVALAGTEPGGIQSKTLLQTSFHDLHNEQRRQVAIRTYEN
jgi:hypothetical protein